jgi:hypothetical protein
MEAQINQFQILANELPLSGLIHQRNNWKNDIHPVGRIIYKIFDAKIKNYEN